MLGGFLGF